MKFPFTSLLGVGLLALSACGSNTDSTTTTTTQPGTMADSASTKMAAGADSAGMSGSNSMAKSAMGADPNGPTAPHANDAEFMMSAAHSDQNEIQLSKMALAKGATGNVKMLADKMIADHMKSTAALKPIAAKAGVTLPADMDADHKAMAPMLEKMSAKDFEAKYVQQMVADHQKTANTLAAHKQMTKNAALTGWIDTTLPVVEGHLKMAETDNNMKM